MNEHRSTRRSPLLLSVLALLVWVSDVQAKPAPLFARSKDCAQASLDGAAKHAKKAKRGAKRCEAASNKPPAPVSPPVRPQPVKPPNRPVVKTAQPQQPAPIWMPIPAPRVQQQPKPAAPKPSRPHKPKQAARPKKMGWQEAVARLGQIPIAAPVAPAPAPKRRPNPTENVVFTRPTPAAAPALPPAAAPAPMAPAPMAPAPAAAPLPAVLAPAAFTPEVALRAKQKRIKAAVARDKLAEGHADVFDVALGEVLALPECSAADLDAKSLQATDGKLAKVSSTCQQPPTLESGALAQAIAGVPEGAAPKGVEYRLVRVAEKRCPTWVAGACTLSVATQSDVVIGVSVLTLASDERAVETKISEKYGTAPTSTERATCAGQAKGSKAKSASDRAWRLPRLAVHYAPLGGLSCEQGRVDVQTRPLTDKLEAKDAKSSEPKM